MSVMSRKFIYANMLRAAEIRVLINVLFSEGMLKLIEAWQPLRTFAGDHRIPSNLYNIVTDRSSYDKSDITTLIRNVLHSVGCANGENANVRVDEMTKARLVIILFLAFIATLYERIDQPYVRELAGKSIIVEKKQAEYFSMNGLSTGEIMGSIVSRLKGGAGWDALVGRFTWWIPDELSMMETLTEPTFDRSLPSIQQFSYIASLIENCTFKYTDEALIRVVQWGNEIELKISPLLGKSVQQMHQFAGFLQTIEYSYSMCISYSVNFKEFPIDQSVDHVFMELCHAIFNGMFPDQAHANQKHQFFICEETVGRAIDLVSDLLQQLRIFMDDSNAPAYNGSHSKTVIILPVNSPGRAEEAPVKKKNFGECQ
ncbi:unnamed protein product [Adineta ricciae]|uniref:Uncharacterized protein n=2 Tax=Adineta ricciae TaxID=249248 RepID=A0A815AHG1_ADIRI|nr:unnamed protein product [Adineta ricciae]